MGKAHCKRPCPKTRDKERQISSVQLWAGLFGGFTGIPAPVPFSSMGPSFPSLDNIKSTPCANYIYGYISGLLKYVPYPCVVL
jgi:hypothetical protein